jgi:hypothetical protein
VQAIQSIVGQADALRSNSPHAALQGSLSLEGFQISTMTHLYWNKAEKEATYFRLLEELLQTLEQHDCTASQDQPKDAM